MDLISYTRLTLVFSSLDRERLTGRCVGPDDGYSDIRIWVQDYPPASQLTPFLREGDSAKSDVLSAYENSAHAYLLNEGIRLRSNSAHRMGAGGVSLKSRPSVHGLAPLRHSIGARGSPQTAESLSLYWELDVGSGGGGTAAVFLTDPLGRPRGRFATAGLPFRSRSRAWRSRAICSSRSAPRLGGSTGLSLHGRLSRSKRGAIPSVPAVLRLTAILRRMCGR